MAAVLENQVTDHRKVLHLLDELVDATSPGLDGFIQAFRMLSSPDFLNTLPPSYLDILSQPGPSSQALVERWASYLRDRKRTQEEVTRTGSLPLLRAPTESAFVPRRIR